MTPFSVVVWEDHGGRVTLFAFAGIYCVKDGACTRGNSMYDSALLYHSTSGHYFCLTVWDWQTM